MMYLHYFQKTLLFAFNPQSPIALNPRIRLLFPNTVIS